MFGFPLHIGSVRFGALNLYNDSPGELRGEQHADALGMADLVAQVTLLLQSNAEPGMISRELEHSTELHPIVHQASGMVAEQLGVSVRDAMARLRGHAFGNDRRLDEVARDVVAREHRLDR